MFSLNTHTFVLGFVLGGGNTGGKAMALLLRSSQSIGGGRGRGRVSERVLLGFKIIKSLRHVFINFLCNQINFVMNGW